MRRNIFLLIVCLVLIFYSVPIAVRADPLITIDGVQEPAWGAPLAIDPVGDMSEPNLDLSDLYVIADADNYYIGFDAFTSNWGMAYGIYIDIDQTDGLGGTSDPWGRAVSAISLHLPEHTLYVYHEDGDTLQDAQLNHWDGSGWSYDSLVSQGGEQAYGSENDWIEFRVPKVALGNPSSLSLELFTTGGSGHAQDSVPSDPNISYNDPDWGGDVTTLSSFVTFASNIPLSVTIAGTLQNELGCSNDWQPDCTNTHLSYDLADDIWQGTFSIPAGYWEYKATLNDSWDENYGLNALQNGTNIPLSLTAGTSVKFYYDHKTHWVTDNLNSIIVTVVGSFQDEIGCPGDWQPDCLRSWLQDIDGDGIYAFSTDLIPPGDYEAKVAINESWDETYGADGVLNGDNIPFSVTEGDIVNFHYNSLSHVLTITSPPSSVTIAGSFQSSPWNPADVMTHLIYDVEDDVWQGTFSIPGGSWEYVAALNDSWLETYGANAILNGPNISLSIGNISDVKFYYDHKTHWITDNVNSVIATVIGNFQDEIGCLGDWQPDCLRSWLQDTDGDGVYTFSTDLIPPGDYEAKVTINESWDENYGLDGILGGPNIPFTVGNNEYVLFSYNATSHVLTISVLSTLAELPYAILHYNRADGDYGDHTTGDYNDFWGLQLWGDITETIAWTNPKPFLGEDEFGRFAWVQLAQGVENVGFIVHQGDTKDGTNEDRFFNPSINPEIWIKSDDPNIYTSQADAQDFVTIHYHRADADYNGWGLHLWGDSIDPSEITEWSNPKMQTSSDDYGIYWEVQIINSSKPVNFIIHNGDYKDPGPDQSFIPMTDATTWIQSGDETIYSQRGAAEGFATLHYHRPAGDYGDYTSPIYNDFWGLHTWGGVDDPGWVTPRKPDSFDTFGAIFKVDLTESAEAVNYILHRGDEKDPGPDQFLLLDIYGYEVWQLQDADPEKPYILPISGNKLPDVDIDVETVIVDEGQNATNSGTVVDADGDPVALTASVGLLVNNNDGTWSWSLSPSDGPDESQTVTITADDGNGGTCQKMFILTVNNLAPSINSISNDGPIIVGDSVSVTINASDPAGVNDPLTYAFDWNEDGVFEIGPQPDAFAIYSYTLPGQHTVNVQVADDDGATATSSTTVIVLSLQEAVDEFISSEVEVLVADGILNKGQGNALLSVLSNVKRQLDKGNMKTAIIALQTFVNQVEAFVKGGILTLEDSQVMIDAASTLIEAMDG